MCGQVVVVLAVNAFMECSSVHGMQLSLPFALYFLAAWRGVRGETARRLWRGMP